MPTIHAATTAATHFLFPGMHVVLFSSVPIVMVLRLAGRWSSRINQGDLNFKSAPVYSHRDHFSDSLVHCYQHPVE